MFNTDLLILEEVILISVNFIAVINFLKKLIKNQGDMLKDSYVKYLRI